MRFGHCELPYGLFLAPMAGVTDRAFRQICALHGAEYTFSEMISAKAVHYNDKKTAELAAFEENEKPLSIQIFGHEADIMAESAAKLADNTYAHCTNTAIPCGIDINMGCPVHKVAGNGDGSALMKDPKTAGEIVRQVVDSQPLPVSVKIRSGWNEMSKNAVEIAKIVEANGACAITVHGRTREQMYSGRADRSVIRDVKRAVSIPVIGNGDVFCASDALQMLEETGCDGIMIGRGAYGNPWIFEEIRAALEGKSYTPPSYRERMGTALDQLRRMIAYKGERIAIPEARKHMGWYVRGLRGSARVRGKINELCTYEEVKTLLEEEMEGGERGSD